MFTFYLLGREVFAVSLGRIAAEETEETEETPAYGGETSSSAMGVIRYEPSCTPDDALGFR